MLGISLPGLFITLAIVVGIYVWVSTKVKQKEEKDGYE